MSWMPGLILVFENQVDCLAYPPGSSRRLNGRICLHGDTLILELPDSRRTYHSGQLEISQALAHTPATVKTEDGWMLEVEDSGVLVPLRQRPGPWHVISFLEGNFRAALLILLACGGLIFCWLKWGVPAGANWVAQSLPTASLEYLSHGAESMLGEFGLSESRLDSGTQARLQFQFRQLAEGLETHHDLRLTFRQGGPIGANAFALPSGLIMMTDDLVELATSDDQLMAVLAHEIGHVIHHHGVRLVLQDSAVLLIISILTGDISGSSALAVALPTLLIDAGYSREFEREADRYALELMRKKNMNPMAFAGILKALSGSASDSGGQLLDYFASHPATTERIDAVNGGGSMKEN